MAVIGTNVGALNAQFYLTRNNEALGKSIRKLSSGSRIADPSDDAAGVAVSGKLDASVRRLIAAAEGSENVISFAQTADGFLQTIQSQLTRMSELAQRATNGAFGSVDRQNYAIEYENLRSQIGRIASNAIFNGASLFSGVGTTVTVAINGEGITDTLAIQPLTLTILGLLTGTGTSLGTIDTTTNAVAAISVMTSAITVISNRRAQVNADVSKFRFHVQNIRTERINVEAANSRIKDLDVAAESTELAKSNILMSAATSMLTQANLSQQQVLQLLRQ
jgi:flagellin